MKQIAEPLRSTDVDPQSEITELPVQTRRQRQRSGNTNPQSYSAGSLK